MEQKKICFIEGNIGVGKSTLLSKLDKNRFNVVDEPMNLFCKLDDLNPLEMFYNKTMTGFQFSTYIVYVFLNILQEKIVPNKINIICRNVMSSVFCFAKHSYELGLMKEIDFTILKQFTKLYSNMLLDYDVKIIYLYADPEICFNRLLKRNRKEESGVSCDYLKKLDKFYNDYIYKQNKYNVITIDASSENEDNVLTEFLKQI